MRPVPSLEIELLLLCATMQVDERRAERIADLLRRDIDWEAIILNARRHGLLPLLHRTLTHVNAADVPSGVAQRLQSLREAIRLRNLVLVAELLNALRAFRTAGITVIPNKGPALAAFLYHDLTLRQFTDIDLLVRQSDAMKARQVLLDQGYISMPRFSELSAAAYLRVHCDFLFTSATQTLVELTWRNAPWYWRLPEIPDAAWNRLTHLSFAGTSVPWFAPEDLFIVLCLHGCKHKWDTLKWIVDIAELLRAHPGLNWRQIMADARRTGAERMIAVGVFLAADLLDAPLPRDLTESVEFTGAVESLAAEVRDKLFAADAAPADTLDSLSFLARATSRLDTRIACRILPLAYFPVHRLVRPGLAALRRAVIG